jgi:antitoxin FitA
MTMATVQVRDVPDEVVATLKERADARGQSLTAYLRDLLTQEAGLPPIDEVMARIAGREPVQYRTEDLRDLMDDGRR